MKGFMKSAFNRFKYPEHLFAGLIRKLWFLFPNDVLFLKIIYRLEMGRRLNLKSPIYFTEKIQWLKIYDRKPEYIPMVDKLTAKNFVSKIIGEKYIIPTIGEWNSFDEIDFSTLPNKFVLKTNHGSGGGGVIICHDKEKLNIDEIRLKFERGLHRNTYNKYREWPYKNIKPRILAEKYMVEDSGCELKDYKIFCFNGDPKIIQLDFDRFSGHKKNLYSTNWKLLPFSFNYPSHPEIYFEKPQKLDEMLEIAKKLSNGLPFVRIDLYWTGDKIYFGEITLYPASGFGKFTPTRYDEVLGGMLHLPTI